MTGRYVVIIIDGDAVDLCKPYTSSLRYDDLKWEDAVELVRLSFEQGFEAVIWRLEAKKTEEGDGGEQEKPAVH